MSNVNLDLMPLDLRSHLVFIKDQIEWFEGGVIDRDENDNPICIRDYCNLDTAKHWLDMFIELEKDLSCPLEIVINSLKGIKIKETNKIVFPKLMWVDEKDLYPNWCFKIEYLDDYGIPTVVFKNLCDYQKTWWLKGEKE